MTDRLRRTGRWLNIHFDLFAILYIAGLFLMIGSDQHHPFAWPFVRAVLWTVSIPVAVGYGTYLGRRE